ncbi:MAG TPA: hypothetical protein DCX82_17065 [Lachnospiraceae bacterium]|jgi:LacI family transcriptional regulator|nr:hypothetical protein [Lachnospiraceae bacterium]
MSTIKDVAKRAGVSIATVSYIINGTKPITAETRERVLQAIEELNYAPNQTAKSFKTGRKNIIAFIVPDISNNYFANIIDSLENELRKSGYNLILTNTKESKENEIQQLKYLASGIADGIVLASAAQDYAEIESYIPESFPVVLIDRKLKNCPLDIINVSDANAITTGMEQLLRKGHTRIGYIGDFPHLSTAKERLQLYLDFLEKNNMPIVQNLIKNTNSLSHEAYYLTGELLKEQCTAIVVGNNIMTADAYNYLANHRELSSGVQILGYQHKDLSHPFSTRDGIIVLNEKDMGIAAAQQILSRIQMPEQPQREIIICNQYAVSITPQ